ncbi:MAG: hypothetical protein ABR541_09315 [Candidatus Dormibacteria bacterium]
MPSHARQLVDYTDSEQEAAETMRILESMGPAYTDELEQIRESEALELEMMGPDYRKQMVEL